LSDRRQLHEFVARTEGVSRQRRLDVAALETLAAFEVVGVEALLLKGPVLARTLYRPEEHRSYADIDLLVSPQRIDDARAVLTELGYVNVSDWFNRAIADETPELLHGEPWGRTTSQQAVEPSMVDLHWRLEGCNAPADAAWEALSAHRASIDIRGRRAPTLDPAGLALHLAIHVAQHGAESLKAVGDLQRGVDRWDVGVWREAADLAQRLDAAAAFAAGLHALPTGAALAAELGLPRSTDRAPAGGGQTGPPRGAFHLEAIRSARGARTRLSLVGRTLFPPKGWIVTQYPWAKGSRIRITAAYSSHLVRAPWWGLRAWRYRRRQLRNS
jgi:hypothetical protein